MTTNALLVDVQIPNPGDGDSIQAAAALERMRQFEIVDTATYQTVATDLAGIKGQWETVEAKRVRLKKPILEAGRGVDELFASPLAFLKQAETIAKSKLDAWTREQARLAKIEQDRLDAIARKERERREAEAREAQRKAEEKAAAERKAADEKRRAEEAEREKARQAENARLKAERDVADAQARGDREARVKAEKEAQEAHERAAAAEKAANNAKAAADKLETRAASTEQRGAERAEMLQQQAASVVAPTVQVDVPQVKGLSSREVWTHEVSNLDLLIDAVIAGKAPRTYLMANDTVLAAMAKALKNQFNVPGVKAFPKTITASKATR